MAEELSVTRYRIIGVLLGLALVGVYLQWQSHVLTVRPLNLLPENAGAISTVAIHYTRDTAPGTGPCYRAFFRSVDGSTRVIAVCGNGSDAAEFRRVAPSWGLNRDRIECVVIGKPITGWCKDRFLVASGKPACLVHPPRTDAGLETRVHDSLVAPALARAYPDRFSTVQIPLEFDAGDIVATRNRVIVSDVLWAKNERRPDLRRLLQRSFGKDVLWLKGAPDHHIGMFAAPLDDHTVMVGDPKLARPLWTDEVESKLGHADFSPEAVAPFDRAAKQFQAAGFRVIRVPTAVIAPRVYVSYTNGVFETRGGRKIAYMPAYDSPALDRLAARLYAKAGWQVKPIPVKTVYRFRGTIGCLVNVVERG